MTVVPPDMAAGAGGSPVGDTVEWHVRERRARSRRYHDTQDRHRPFEEIARAVIMRRTHLGWTQQDLAHRIGTTTLVIARIESGRLPAASNTLQRVAEALGGPL